ncbi:winged helix-turn-helix transcriptional regulator [Paenibacillus durus]|uniref:winged helix-turn-helix transcriptional regulator n=1 Tax=Paenibacillus durus TaxID=44251 RepID=UPI0004725F1C|nr:helix-turn-helix domain-containing protein [Paenibacillus durus]
MDSPTRIEECVASVNKVMFIFGGKWSLLVFGQLLNGPQRFNELRRNVGGISTKSLSDILRHFEENEIVSRVVYPTVPVSVEYSLTDKGRDLQSVLMEMGQWGGRWEN